MADKTRRVLKKVDHAKSSGWENQLWPINVALLVMSGFVAGVIIVKSDFDHPQLFYNGWARLTTLGLTLVVLLVTAYRLDKVMARRLQLAVLTSLIFHIALAIFLTKHYVEMIAKQEAERAELLEPKELPTRPEYHLQNPEAPTEQQSHEKPLETQAPEAQPEETPRQETTPREQQPMQQPVTLPKPEAQIKPSPVELKRTQVSTPRRAEHSSKLSKQTAMAQSQAQTNIASPKLPTPSESQANRQLNSQSTQVDRQQTATKTPTQSATKTPETVRQNQQVQMANRATRQSTPTKSSSRPTLQKQVAQPAAVPRAQAVQNVASKAAQQTKPQELTAQAQVTRRNTAVAPQPQQQPVEPTPQQPTVVQKSETARQQPSEKQPTIARTAKATPTRQTTQRTIDATAATVPKSAATQETTSRSAPGPKATTVTRRSSQVPNRTPSPAQLANAPNITQSQAAGPTAVTRAKSADAPSVNPHSTPTSRPRRAAATSAVVSSPSPVTRPATQSATQSTATQQLAASSTSITRSQTSSPRAAKQSTEPAPITEATVSQPGASRSTATESRPTVANNQSTTPTRRTGPSATTPVTPAAADSPSVTVAQATPKATPGPKSTDVSRSASRAPQGSNMQQPSTSAPQVVTTGPSSPTAVPRAVQSNSPSLKPTSSPTSRPRRTQAETAVAASPVAVDSPALAQSTSQNRPTARPASAALSKATTGFVGRGRSQNADVAMQASPRNSAPVPAAAARRAKASQQKAGPDLSPSAPARLTKARAGAEAPAATMRAQQVEVATTAGSQKPGQISVSASAAVQRTASTAPTGAVTAAVGTLEVDTGATQIVPNVGSGRAAGGGQPKIALNPQTKKIARARSGGAALAAVNAAAVQPVPSAPSSTGGGSPQAPQPTSLASSAGGKTSDSKLPTSVSLTESSPAGAGGSGTPVAAAALSRAGTGTPAGAGQPEVAKSAQGEKISKTQAGGASLAAIAAADLTTPKAAAPSGSGGGAPTGPQASDVAADAGKRGAGASLPTLAQSLSAGQTGSSSNQGQVSSTSPARASTAETLPGMTAGGGTAQPVRGKGATLAALSPGQVPQLNSTPNEGGAPQSTPVAAQGIEAGDFASGLPGRASTSPVGAAAGPMSVDTPSASGSPGSGITMAKAVSGSESAPSLGSTADSSAPLKKGSTAALPSGAATLIDQPTLAAAGGGKTGGGDMSTVAPGADLPARSAGSLPVRVEAPTGPGGLGLQFTAVVGLPSRRAQREAKIVHQVPDRYLQKKVGGAPVVSGTARDVAAAFTKRGQRQDDMRSGGDSRPSAKTEVAIESGVDFLARHQLADGSWSFRGFGQGRPGYEKETASIQSDSAATGLALLAMLGAGYDHFDDKYKNYIRGGLNFLVSHQQESGNLYIAQDSGSNQVAQLYSHGIATIALCEAHGMTGDPEIGKAAQKAIDFIVASQHKTRGGWRYTPGYMSDLSVTGWQVMALKSGELSGLKVPKKTYELVEKFLDRCRGPGGDGSRYMYNPWAVQSAKTQHGRRPSTVMTSVGLLMRQYTGWDRTRPEMKRGADYLLANLPRLGTADAPAQIGTARNPLRDTYYWYYATQVMFHMKGKYWKAWNERLHPLLSDSQIQQGAMAGSWDPRGQVADKWGPHGGRIYVTAMNLLSLEVYYRHLPLYEDTGK